MNDRDVTELVEWCDYDSEVLPIVQCVCGAKFVPWRFIISIYRDGAVSCPECGRKLYFSFSIRVFEVSEEE